VGLPDASIKESRDRVVVAAMNPCPCGNLGHREKECVCNPYQIKKYQNRIPGL
jgi:magnesium chelatase family protein